MKKLLIFVFLSLCLSSCLKDSISDAMIKSENASTTNSSNANPATITYTVNGTIVNVVIKNPDKQSPTNYLLGCTKESNNQYYLASESGGNLIFFFYTDSLKVGRYHSYVNNNSPLLDFSNVASYHAYATDSLGLKITSFSKGHISGTFSGRLTPLIEVVNYKNIYGKPGSTIITDGSFKNVPVFY